MSYYKGFEVDDGLQGVIRHMENVEHYRDNLRKHQIVWDYLSVLGQLDNLGVELTQTRKQFTELTQTLLNQLGLALLKKSVDQYAFKAQVAINIMTRNLFERTADIGFLAMDDDIRGFLLLDSAADAELFNQKRHYLREHFRQYAAKYSVYHNIILLDTNGNVLLQLDENNPVTQSKDPLIKESLHTKAAYVENYRHSDLLPNELDSLIFSYRVESADDGRALGVICLCFRFENECAGIFANLLHKDALAIFCLLDKEGIVIASSGDNVALNTKFNLEFDNDYSVVTHDDEEYFCCTRRTEGFQGYFGAGWFGHVMVPLDQIFSQAADVGTELPADLVHAIMQGPLFNTNIKNIPLQASQIQRELDRLVWNGNVQQTNHKSTRDAAVSKVLLSEIKRTAVLTKQIFENSIADIQNTVTASALQNSMDMAALAIDIMDRNLYERANDCRWWALTTTLRTQLAKKQLRAEDIAEIQSLLSFINSLYTVYSNILVFDSKGKVIAESNPQAQPLQGSVITEPWVAAALALQSPQDYVVSAYEATPLYNNLPTYIYVAVIQSLDKGQAIGGIGIVFDAAQQFITMLQDVQHSEAHANSFAIFTDASKTIISSSTRQLSVGQILEISDDFYALESGQSISKLINFNQHHYAVGCSKSACYREYKSAADHYQEEVFSFVFIFLGEDVPAMRQIEATTSAAQIQLNPSSGTATQMATFFVGNSWLGLRSDQVANAAQAKNYLPIRGGEQPVVAGYLIYKGDSLALIHTSMLLGASKPEYDADQPSTEIVVAKINGGLVGLIVDGLGEMLDVSHDQIHPIGADIAAYNKIVHKVVLPNAQQANEKMLQIVDIEMLYTQLHGAVSMSA
jgi:chemotaxis signal transduction protein